jgi:hypothetical protein
MVSKSQMFLIYSFLYVLLDPHRNFHVEEFFKNIFKKIGCGIMLYMLTIFLTLIGSKAYSFSVNP